MLAECHTTSMHTSPTHNEHHDDGRPPTLKQKQEQTDSQTNKQTTTQNQPPSLFVWLFVCLRMIVCLFAVFYSTLLILAPYSSPAAVLFNLSDATSNYVLCHHFWPCLFLLLFCCASVAVSHIHCTCYCFLLLLAITSTQHDGASNKQTYKQTNRQTNK